MLTALTKSKKPHQIATGFDQSSHATLIGLPPQALPNAHESVIRPTYKARSSQTFGRRDRAICDGDVRSRLAPAAFRFDPGAVVALLPDLRLLNVLFLKSQGVPSVSR